MEIYIQQSLFMLTGYIYVNTLYTEAKKARIKFTGEKTNTHNPQRPRSYIRDTHIQQLLRSMHYC